MHRPGAGYTPNQGNQWERAKVSKENVASSSRTSSIPAPPSDRDGRVRIPLPPPRAKVTQPGMPGIPPPPSHLAKKPAPTVYYAEPGPGQAQLEEASSPLLLKEYYVPPGHSSAAKSKVVRENLQERPNVGQRSQNMMIDEEESEKLPVHMIPAKPARVYVDGRYKDRPEDLEDYDNWINNRMINTAPKTTEKHGLIRIPLPPPRNRQEAEKKMRMTLTESRNPPAETLAQTSTENSNLSILETCHTLLASFKSNMTVQQEPIVQTPCHSQDCGQDPSFRQESMHPHGLEKRPEDFPTYQEYASWIASLPMSNSHYNVAQPQTDVSIANYPDQTAAHLSYNIAQPSSQTTTANQGVQGALSDFLTSTSTASNKHNVISSTSHLIDSTSRNQENTQNRMPENTEGARVVRENVNRPAAATTEAVIDMTKDDIPASTGFIIGGEDEVQLIEPTQDQQVPGSTDANPSDGQTNKTNEKIPWHLKKKLEWQLASTSAVASDAQKDQGAATSNGSNNGQTPRAHLKGVAATLEQLKSSGGEPKNRKSFYEEVNRREQQQGRNPGEHESTGGSAQQEGETSNQPQEDLFDEFFVAPQNVIAFNGPHHFLSMIYEAPFSVSGRYYGSVEHFYQATKVAELLGLDYAYRIQTIEDQSTVRRATHDLLRQNRVSKQTIDEWKRKFSPIVLYTGVWNKFRQNLTLAEQLMSTGNRLLANVYRGDSLAATGCEKDEFFAWVKANKGVIKIPSDCNLPAHKFPLVAKGHNIMGVVNMWVRKQLPSVAPSLANVHTYQQIPRPLLYPMGGPRPVGGPMRGPRMMPPKRYAPQEYGGYEQMDYAPVYKRGGGPGPGWMNRYY